MWRPKANDGIGGTKNPGSSSPKDSFHYNRELIFLITQFTKVLQIWIALGLHAGLEGSHKGSELGKLTT